MYTYGRQKEHKKNVDKTLIGSVVQYRWKNVVVRHNVRVYGVRCSGNK